MWRTFLQSITQRFKHLSSLFVRGAVSFYSYVYSAARYVKTHIPSAYKFFRDDFSKLILSFSVLLFVVFVVYWYLKAPSILIEPFQAPEDLAQQGLSGPVIAQKLLDEINVIKAKTRTSTYPRGAMLPGSIEPNIVPSQPAQDLDVMIQGTSLNSLIRYIAFLLGRDVRITGEIVRDSETWNATMRISSDPRPIVISSTDFQDLLRKLALGTLRVIKPTTLVEFYYATNNSPALMSLIDSIILNGASNEDLALAYNFWGLNLCRENKCEESLSKYRKAVEIDPDAAYVHINWGSALHELGNNDNKVRSKMYELSGLQYEKASQINPQLAATYVNWGNLLHDQKRYREAEKKLRLALTDPAFKSYAANSLALVLEDQNKTSEAIEMYEAAIRDKPGLTIPYVNVSQLLGKQDRYKDGYAKLEEAASIDPRAFEVYWAWGLLLSNEGKYDQAITKYKTAVRLNPGFDELHVKWGANLYALKDYKEAETHFRQAADLNSKNHETYYNWGAALKELGMFDEAIAKFEKSKELNPSKKVEIDNLIKQTSLAGGRRLRKEGKFLEAIRNFQKATEIDPQYGEGFFESGFTLMQMENYEASIPEFQKAFNVSPHLTDALVNLGIGLIKTKRYDEAGTQLRLLIEKKPDHRDVYFLLGEVYLGLHKKEDAKEAFVSYLNKEPKGIYVERARKALLDLNVTARSFPDQTRTP